MNFNVIIPVVHSNLCDDVIRSLEANSIKPKRLVIIDNTKDRNYQPESEHFPIDTYYSEKGYVNESWNLGLSKVDIVADYISILNDDIYLNRFFFQRIIETFQTYADCGCACPHTVEDKSEMSGRGVGKRRITRMIKREGWCMTFKKEVLDHIAPIPSHKVQIFHGDDWYWFWSKTRGQFWYKDMGNLVWHKGGASIISNKMRGRKKEERNAWRGVMGELGG
ncbi:MAG: hypothetical protein AM326_07240 [Candidatus Thorarchaeota archaeon SMTZ-45]|nr:MAG: hypothetical protein AM326_07240 [Candidatus Thorarchaeota archaeon SMTZ-45]